MKFLKFATAALNSFSALYFFALSATHYILPRLLSVKTNLIYYNFKKFCRSHLEKVCFKILSIELRKGTKFEKAINKAIESMNLVNY